MKQEEVPPRPKPMKSADLEAFLKVLGSPTKIYFDLISVDTDALDNLVRESLSHFKGHIMPPDIRYQAWEIPVLGAESGKDYVNDLLETHRKYEDYLIKLQEHGGESLTEEYRNRLMLRKLRWEIDKVGINVEITITPPRIEANYQRRRTIDAVHVAAQIGKESKERRIPYVLPS